jgi:hypothetical protein
MADLSRRPTHIWRSRLLRASVIVAATALMLIITYAIVVSPWHKRWGATDAEVAAVLPGDELVPQALDGSQTTRGITINTSTEAIWPWLVQMGQSKAGLYSYEMLENLLGCNMTNADTIHPEWQQTQVGDNVGMYPEGSGPPPFRVAALLPNRAFITGHPIGDKAATITPQTQWNDTWAFVLQPIDDHTTRLLMRARWSADAELSANSPIMKLVEPGEFIMARAMLWGIKERAERAAGISAAYTASEGWGAAFMLIAFVALASIVFSKKWPLKLGLIAVGATAWWLVLFFGHPSLIYSGILAVAALGMAAWAFWPIRLGRKHEMVLTTPILKQAPRT